MNWEITIGILAVLATLLFVWLGIRFIRRSFWFLKSRNKTCCLSCRYDLTGNMSGVCPECGWEIPDQPTITKRRRRRLWTYATLGLALLAVPAGTWWHFWPQLAASDVLQRNKPIWWLKVDLGSSDEARAGGALAEIINRDAAGKLSATGVQSIADVCLAIHARQPFDEGHYPVRFGQKVIDQLGAWYVGGLLTQSQMDGFDQVVCEVGMRSRDILVQGMDQSVLFTHHTRLPQNWMLHIEPGQVQLSEKPIHINRCSMEGGGGGTMGVGFDPADFVGKGEFEVEIIWWIVQTQSANPRKYTKKVKKSLTVVPFDESADLISFSRSKASDECILDNLRIEHIAQESAGSIPNQYLTLTLWFEELEKSVAFRVFAVDGAKVIELGEMAYQVKPLEPGARRSDRYSFCTSFDLDELLPDKIDLLLVADWSVAYRMIETEVWGGALLYGGVDLTKKRTYFSKKDDYPSPKIVDPADYGIPDLTKPTSVTERKAD